jgi:hypothetical protein
MEKQKAHLNKKYNKIRPKTPLMNKRYNSSKVSQPKKSNKHHPQKKSPKTIDYDKLMEKYGNLVDSNYYESDESKINKNQRGDKSPLNRNPDSEQFSHNLYKTDILMDEENNYSNENIKYEKIFGRTTVQKQKMATPLIKNYNKNGSKKNIFNNIPNNKRATIVINRYNNNNSKNNILKKDDNIDIEKLKNQINYLKQENEKLKSYTIANNQNNSSNNENYMTDKLLLLLNLCRKYAKKFNKLYPLCKPSNNPEIFEELKNTIIQYSKMIFSDKITNLFKLKNNLETMNEYDNILNPLDISEFEPKSISINISEKYKLAIKGLKEENEEMKKKLLMYEEQIKNKDKDDNSLQQKMEEISNENENLKNKINEFIQKENKYNYQTNVIQNLKCQIDMLNNNIKTKENTINYLKSLLEKSNINQNLYKSDSTLNSIQSNINNNNDSDKTSSKEKKFVLDNNLFKENNVQTDKNNINRYEINNNISKISISTYNPNFNSNYYNSKIDDSNNNNLNQILEEQKSKDILYNLKDNLKNISSINKEYIMISNEEEKISDIKNFDSDSYQINYEKKKDNLKNGKERKKEQIVLNNEIEQLDQEILNLKSKLTKIIKK